MIFGCAGPDLDLDERAFFADANPLGFILFKRNCASPAQLADLVAALRDTVGRSEAPVLIDQEGGRVARLGPPHWRARPAAQRFAQIAGVDPARGAEAARLNARLMAAELADVGIDVDCAPVLDVPVPGAHDIIGDRAHGTDPATVAALGRAVCQGLIEGGVLPVIKHVPGHGRARADSHIELPRVDTPLDELRRSDFAPFRALNHMPWAMTAHVLYGAIDRTRAGSVSPIVIEDVIRGDIGFTGFLLSDDVCMKALSGSEASRTQAVLAAGCDAALHCSGILADMRAVAEAAGPLTRAAADRFARAYAMKRPPQPLDRAAAEAHLASVLGALQV